jgi:hypothetical protein
MGQMILPRLHTKADLTTPAELANNAAWYSLEGAPGPQTYITDGDNRISLRADRSGNSGVNGLVLPKVNNNDASTLNAVANQITGDIGMRMFFLWNAAPTGDQSIAAKWAGAGTRAWAFNVDSNGIARLYLTTNGTDLFSGAASVAVATTGLLGLGVTRRKSDGVTTFYTSADGVTWTALGTTTIINEDGAIFNSSEAVRIGGITGSAGQAVTVFSFELFNDATFTNRVQYFNPTVASKLATSLVASTGETWTINQTDIALPARIHGARDRYQHIVANRAIYLTPSATKYGWLNGTAGNYFSTPDSVAASITGDIEIIACVASSDWASASTQSIVSKHNYSANERSWVLDVRATSQFNLILSQDGTNIRTAQWNAGYTGSGIKYIKVSADLDDGSNLKVYWYDSPDGVVWTLRATNTLVSLASLLDNNNPVLVGRTGSLATNTDGFNGRILSVQVYNGIDGPLAVNFDPTAFVSGTTWTAPTTGETWTRNAGAYIGFGGEAYYDGSNDYDKTPPFPLAQPVSVYFGGSQVSWTSTDYVLDGGGTNGGAIIQTTATPQLNINAGSSVGANTGLAVGAVGVLRAIFNGAASALGVNIGAGVTGNAGAGNMNGVTIGARGAGDANYGNITESIMIIRSVADAEPMQTRIARWMMRKLNISG